MFFVFLITTLILNYIILSDGVSVEEMAAEVNKRTDALENAQRELRDMQSLNRALKHSIKRRLLKWHDFRRHIALRCKIYFQSRPMSATRAVFVVPDPTGRGRMFWRRVRGMQKLYLRFQYQSVGQAYPELRSSK